jgi:acetyl esterase/lipase
MQSILDLPPPKANARIDWGSKMSQFGDLRLPKSKGPHPVVIFFHGGYWRAAYDLTHTGHICAALTQAGVATWNLEYRKLGEPGGGWAGIFDDVLAGARYLPKLAHKYNLDLNRIVTAGHSAGGQLALWLAAQMPLVGVTSLAGVCDFRLAWELKLSDGVVGQLLGGTPKQVPKRYDFASPIELIPIKTPQRLVHGTADNVVPFEMSERFARKSKNAKLFKCEGAGHFDLIDPRTKQWPVVRKAITEW